MNIKKIIQEEVSKFLKEFYINDIVSLEKYLTLSDQEKRESLPNEYSYLILPFLNTSTMNLNKYNGITDKEIVDDLKENNPYHYKKFQDFLYDGVKNKTLNIKISEYPAWSFFGKPTLVTNKWMVHFTTEENAEEIKNNGFTKGVSDHTKLGATTDLSDFEKQYGGYNFGYLAKEANNGFYASILKYGDTAVVFKASGLRTYHHIDQEPQVIFYGNTADHINLIKKIDGVWCVISKDDTILYKNEKFMKTLEWFVNNYEQYRNQLNELNTSDEKWTKDKIAFYKNNLKDNPIKFKYAIGVLDTIEKNDGKISDKQKQVVLKAMRGESGNINYSSKN